jgi:asparagine synthase (glutamine-hydrolysing)
MILDLDGDAVPLEELAWFLDEPLADLSSLGFYALCGLAREHVTVALSGQGADELLAGYRKHRAAALAGAYARAAGRPGRAVARAVGSRSNRLRQPARALGARDAVERLIAAS